MIVAGAKGHPWARVVKYSEDSQRKVAKMQRTQSLRLVL